MAKHDLAVRWNDKALSIARVKSMRGIPLHGYPRHLRCPGGTVAVVQNNGRIALMFTANQITGPKRVKLANGKIIQNGYIVEAKSKSLIKPGIGNQMKLNFKWYALDSSDTFMPKPLGRCT